MDILYLLIPLSVVLVLAILAVFGWALHGGQFDDLEREGERILTDEIRPLDADQAAAQSRTANNRTFDLTQEEKLHGKQCRNGRPRRHSQTDR